MAQCAYCKTETELYEARTPVCLHCANLSPQKRAIRCKLYRDMSRAVERADAANEAFAAIASSIPSGAPHPDGVQRIHNVARELTEARDAMTKAHNRLTDFLNTGIVPDDLKAH